MVRIKIKSNPYLREIVFYRWNEDESAWQEITLESNPNSMLVRDDIRKGFFPFIVKSIVDNIIYEYSEGDKKTEIEFEGTSDEFYELNAVCSEEEYKDKVQLSLSRLFLENARSILPGIREIYKKVEPLIKISVTEQKDALEREIVKFVDASGDQIPICVIGNYSTGKSTFINALIGYEILPSGDEPITGKIYRISNSKKDDLAYINYYRNGKKVSVRLEENISRISNESEDTDLETEIRHVMDENASASIQKRVSLILEIIEKYTKGKDNQLIDDLIDLSVPFSAGLWDETNNNYVIFDTPGSNSASNIDHVKVLKKAMEDMSNGMPIFVSEYNSLDSTDNEKLYKDIKAMKELDSRFTMIIVNKADTADLEEEDGKIGLPSAREQRLLNMAVPKNLYGEGLFFVSSIMGLGAKTGGKFLDKHYLRVFAQNKGFYSDPEDELYQRLYRYNVMPEQLKKKEIEDAQEKENVVYANSGLYSVEREIQNFGNKYSSYNKCHQSELFLNKVLDITDSELVKSKEKRESVKKKLIDSLEKDKQELIKQIQDKKTESSSEFETNYPHAMEAVVNDAIQSSYEESLLDEKEEYTNQLEDKLNVGSLKENKKNSSESITHNLFSKVKSMIDENDFSGLKTIGEEFVDDVITAVEDSNKLRNVQKIAREKADEMIIDKKNSDYWMHSVSALQKINENSRKYWDQCSEDIKTRLCEIVTGSTALTPERRDQLSKIIIDYENIPYDFIREDRFDKEKFKKGLFVGTIILFKTNELNLKKLLDYFNNVMEDNIRFIAQQVDESHTKSFTNWIEALEEIILENIVEFNPELNSQNELIKDESRLIAELESRQKLLNDYRHEISNMMVWKS